MVTYVAYNIIILSKFCWSLSFLKLCLPWHFVHHSLALFQKCTNLRDYGYPYEFPDLWPPNSPEFNPVDYKIWDNEFTRQKCRI